MPKYNQILKEMYSDTVFLLRHISKWNLKFNHAWNHISKHPEIANDNILSHKRGTYPALCNLLFGPKKVKMSSNLKKPMSFLCKTHIQQSLVETNGHVNNISKIYLAKTRHIINELVDVLKCINNTIYHHNLVIDSLSYIRGFLLTLAQIYHILSQLHNRLMKLDFGVSTIYKYIDVLNNEVFTSMLVDPNRSKYYVEYYQNKST